VLKVDDGDVLVTNVPVPKAAYWADRMMSNAIHLRQLSSVRVLRRLIYGGEYVPTASEVEDEATNVAGAVFRKLHAWHERQGSTLVLVYLPMPTDYRTPPNVFRRSVRQLAKDENLNFIDLTESINSLELKDMLRLYDGHFNEQGNQFIAESLYSGLLEIPEVATALRPESQD
jgi:hypothetical protein